MRKLIYYMAAIIMVLAMGCNQPTTREFVDMVPHELRINPTVDEISTKAIGTQWEELDTIFIVYNYRAIADAHNEADLSNHAQAVYREGQWEIIPTIYYPVGDSVLDLRFYHNISGNLFVNNDSTFILNLSLYNNDTTEHVVDPLYYALLGATNTTEPINVNLEHRLSQLSLKTNNPNIKVLAIMQYYDTPFSLMDGTTWPVGQDTVELTNSQVVIPQYINRLIINEQTYDKKIIVEPGKMTELNITFTGKSVDFNMSLSDWVPGMVYNETITI